MSVFDLLVLEERRFVLEDFMAFGAGDLLLGGSLVFLVGEVLVLVFMDFVYDLVLLVDQQFDLLR